MQMYTIFLLYRKHIAVSGHVLSFKKPYKFYDAKHYLHIERSVTVILLTACVQNIIAVFRSNLCCNVMFRINKPIYSTHSCLALYDLNF
jgi:hypothetical protein